MPILEHKKKSYLIWFQYYQILPKSHRHSLGVKIDTLFIEIIESISVATFLVKTDKLPYLQIAMRKLDTLKILLMILWETKSIDNKKYAYLSKHLDDIGRMLGGWYGKLK